MKSISHIIAAAAAATLLVLPCIVNAETGTEFLNEDFESDVSASTWIGAYTVKGSVNKYLASDTEKGKELYCYLSEELTEGAVISSYDVMIPKQPSSAIRIKQVWDGGLSKRPYYIMATASGNIVYNNTITLGTYSVGKWFNVTEIVDLAEKKVYVYINGKAYGAGQGLPYNDEEATGIKRIQTQYGTNDVCIDNAYVSSYTDKTSAVDALVSMLEGKAYLQKSIFTVEGSKTAQNAITPLTQGTVVVSYDITTTGKARLMQIYDAQEKPKRTVLIQLNSAGIISVNGNGTGVEWKHNTPNNLTLVFNTEDKTSTVFVNGGIVGRENYAVHSDDGICLADIRTQDEDGGGLTVSGAWAKSFASYEDAISYVNAACNVSNTEVAAHYNADIDELEAAFDDYSRAIDALTCTPEEKTVIMEKIVSMLPYTFIFSDSFNAGDEVTGYTASAGAEVTSDGVLKLTNAGERARLLKTVASAPSQFSVSFDFMQPERDNIDSIVRITDNVGNKEAVKLYAKDGDIIMMYGPLSIVDSAKTFEKTVLVDGYETNKWYSIELYADMDTQKTTVYIDGIYKGSYDFMYSDIENMRRVFDTYTDTEGAYCIDNLNVYYDRLKSAAANITVPTSIVSDIALPENAGDYSCEWSSDDVVIDADGSVLVPDSGSVSAVLTLKVSNGVVAVSTDYKTSVASDEALYDICDVVFMDENGVSTTHRNEAVGIKRVYIKRYQDVNGKLIAAQYNSRNELVDVFIADADDGICSLNLPFAQDTNKIMLFLWDSAQLSIPFANAKEL